MRRHWGKALFGIVVTVVALWFVLREVSFAEVWANMLKGDPWLILAAVAVATAGFFIRALRWKVLLAPVEPNTRLRSRFAAVSIGFMANNVLPARIGEFARAFAFGRMEPVSASAAFGSLVVERFMDGVVLLGFLILPALLPGFPATEALSEGAGGDILRGGVIAVMAVLVVLVATAFLPRPFIRFTEWFTGFLPDRIGGPLLHGLEAFLSSLAIVRDPRLLVVGFAWTLFFWTWHGVSFWLAMLAFGIDTGFMSAIFTEAVVGFAVALPAAPGFFGTFHLGADFALTTVYGVEATQSLAFAFAYHIGGWIPITAIGLYYAWKLGLSLGDVGAAEDRVDAAATAASPGSDSPGA